MLRRFWAKLRKKSWAVWFHDAYRLPLSGTEQSTGLELRRAHHALTYLMRAGAVSLNEIHRPQAVGYLELGRVHTSDWLEALSRPAALAHVFAIEEADVVTDTLMQSIRLACGGTLEAARFALAHKIPCLNLLGGFHHAAPFRGAGFCALNDVAIAIAALRADGFDGRVAIIDLDAHPPDGTAECLKADRNVHIASISGVSWGDLPGVDDVVLPRAQDAEYLAALDGLLSRVPPCALAFILAGGDVIAGDRLGTLGLSLEGARERDLKVAQHFRDIPSVWLPAGGYGAHAWKVLAGTGLALAFGARWKIPASFDPLSAEFGDISQQLSSEALSSSSLLSEDDFPQLYGRKPKERLLGYYSAEGIEYALERYGILPLIRRLGFDDIQFEVSANRFRVRSGKAVILELEVSKEHVGEDEILFVNWLLLQNPKAHFSNKRPKLPGQETPGLGLAQEAALLLALMAERLKLKGVAFRPSWFHMAYAGRKTSRFVDPKRQGRFEALVRDLAPLSLLEATHAVADGRVRLNGEPYTWEPDFMVRWLHPEQHPVDEPTIAEERERCLFSVEARTANPAPSDRAAT